MMTLDFYQELAVPARTKIVLLLLDGLGGLPREPGGKTELESAQTPNLDALAERSILGLTEPAGPGITVGSGPGHLAIFGYDPIEYRMGRGILEALGVDFEIDAKDVAARGNFCSLDTTGVITDRRAGRLATPESQELVERLQTIRVDGVEFFVKVIKEHRFAFVMRGEGLSDALSDTDPIKTGVPPLPVRALTPDSSKAAACANAFIEQGRKLLASRHPANMLLLRGFSKFPKIPTFQELYRLNPASIAVNGMYRGVSRLVGMSVLDLVDTDIAGEFATLEKFWDQYDFFYMHVKHTDTYGEMGDFANKVRVIEEVDSFIPRLMALDPDVVIVGGDHSSPAVLRSHSWHPVPVLLYSRVARTDGIPRFGERDCLRGSLGIRPAKHILPIALAHAGRLAKFGA